MQKLFQLIMFDNASNLIYTMKLLVSFWCAIHFSHLLNNKCSSHAIVVFNSSKNEQINANTSHKNGKVGSFNKFTQQQLLNTKFPHKISDDIDLDPCKSGTFYDDVALPNFQYELELAVYKIQNYITETMWKQTADVFHLANKSRQYLNRSAVGRNSDKRVRYKENDLIGADNLDGYLNTAAIGADIMNDSRTISPNSGQDGYLVFSEELLPELIVDPISESETNSSDFDAGVRHKRAATARKERIWDYGVIPYEIDSHFDGMHRLLFKQAMRHWENYTCIKFVERSTTEHNNYIIFTERPCGCCSFVGKRGNGAQAISIGKNCDKFGIVVHELGHVVGFWHEHTRPDRDNHVQIVRDHIMQGQEYNFNKLTDEEVNSMGLPYDYQSIMHYARNTFSKGSYLDTIYPIESNFNSSKRPEIGQRIRLSPGDIAQTKLLYKCPKCGQTFQQSAGSFSHYQTNVNGTVKCEWRIVASHGERIQLNITDLDINKSDQCRTDYLEVRDGYWQKSKLIGRYCGNGWIKDLITTNTNRMLIVFVISDKNYQKRGFSANYEVICGGEINVVHLEVGHLESPNYPEDYNSNKECLWIFTAPETYQVALKFQSFEIENHDNCAYDYIEIHSGDNADSPLIGTYCGYKLPPDIRSSTNKLYVKFVSDGTVQKPGFSALYMTEFDECSLNDHGCEQVCINNLGKYECACKAGYQLHSDNKHCEDICGGRIDEPNGSITSPSFPDIYPANKSCVWEIYASPQHRITLNFTHFDLEGDNTECEYDRVEVYSKSSANHLRRHGVYCGNHLPPIIVSDKNVLRIEFESDSTIHKSGFAAIFFSGQT